jgi:transposase
MEYFAGLDVSMNETHVCVVTQDGAVIHEVRAPSTPADKQVPTCRRVLFETGRMAPMLYHGLSQLGLPAYPPRIPCRSMWQARSTRRASL